MGKQSDVKSNASNASDPFGRLRDQAQLCFEALLYKDHQGYLGEFIQGLIHNFNGPLQNMSMLVELIVAGQKRANDFAMLHLAEQQSAWTLIHEKQNQRLGQVSEQIGKFVEMLRDIIYILELERAEGGLDVNHVMTRLLQVFRADLFFKHQVTMDLRLASGLPRVGIPANVLISALVHLFRNAMIAMRDSHDKKLTIQTYGKKHHVWYVLRDTGCGYAPEQADMLFEPYFSGWRVDASKPDKHDKHLGMGLFTVRMALLPYGGTVSIERDRQETVASLKLPVSRHNPQIDSNLPTS